MPIQYADGGLAEQVLGRELGGLEEIPSGATVIVIEGRCEHTTDLAPGEQLQVVAGHRTI